MRPLPEVTLACLLALSPVLASAQAPEDPSTGAEAIDGVTLSAVQQQLSAAGFDAVRPTGAMDRPTLDALRQFQQSRGLRPTGRLDDATRAALLRQAPALPGEGPPPSTPPAAR
jgi:hypothetical protein